MKKKLISIFPLILIAVIVHGELRQEETTSPEVALPKRSLLRTTSLSQSLPLKVQEAEKILEESQERLEVLETVRRKFRQELSRLKETTRQYNQKALDGALTEKDEEEYETTVQASVVAYEQYKNTFIKLNHEKEN